MAPSNDQLQAFQQRVDDVAYELRDRDLLRFRDSDVDQVVHDIVAQLKAMSSALVQDDSDTQFILELYSQRCIVRALRSSSLTLALDGVDAQFVMNRSAYEDWRRATLVSAFVATSLGAMPQSIIGAATNLDDPIWTEAVTSITDNVTRIDSLFDLGLLVVQTHYGIGVMDAQMERQTPTSGIFSIYPTAPILTKSADQQSGAQDVLAMIVVALADAVETSPSVLAHHIGFSNFPADALMNAGLRFNIDVATCISMMLYNDDVAQDLFEVFVAELGDDDQVSELVQLVSENPDEHGFVAVVGCGPYLAMMFAVPQFDVPVRAGDDESEWDDDVLEPPEGDESMSSPTKSPYFAQIERALELAVRDQYPAR
jgi:hypothetical protein